MAPEALIEKIATDMGLRDPILVQFGRYMYGVVRGDLGQSFVRPANGASTGGANFNDTTRGERASVLGLIMEVLPMTLQLAAVTLVIALVFSGIVGIAGGLAIGRWPDKLAFYVSSVFISLPNFWLGIVLALLFSVKLGWPAGDRLSRLRLYDPAGHRACGGVVAGADPNAGEFGVGANDRTLCGGRSCARP